MSRHFDYDPSYFHAHDGYPRGWYRSRYPPPRNEYYSQRPYDEGFESHPPLPKRRRQQFEDRRVRVPDRTVAEPRFAHSGETEGTELEDGATDYPPGTNVYEYECDIPKDVSPGLIIGTGGRNLRDIQEKGVDVHVGDEGTIYIKAHDVQTFNQAKTRIKRLLKRITRKRPEAPAEARDMSGSASPVEND
ncbi:hypothetical protein CYMTET_41742 [Cymbomonas tetramitiformis]|uniref:K Homology domain-containing protein n=1 Tax=Cymbomonas tetramitiformis TaxID=36881 RepID=A0AAE0BFA1_9CHLO|nr:hypothetical protein CYMTET_54290 [Cymbomonas tetramitiformis]KAK3236086.1 hypothetical protein CYMTET_53755 [Cymbomonas tetramitiformis]KAK3248832.1 hypothetical protein CYMTET_41742 [Cymbomonas tetramitiformis]